MVLAICVFTMIITAVYTANLAAVLLSSNNKFVVQSLKDVTEKGYKICTTRELLQLDLDLGFDLTEMIINDPLDGLPGFISRSRVFDMMKLDILPSERNMFCEVAIAYDEDLVALHTEKKACNISATGEVLALRQMGLPISPLYFDSLWPMLHFQFNKGSYDREVLSFTKKNLCPNPTSSSSTQMSIIHMAGVWLVTLLFATTGFILHIYETRKIS